MMTENGGNSTVVWKDPKTGHWLPGNPGRPLGSKNKSKRAISEMLQDRQADALAALDELISKAHPQAVMFALEKGLPAQRAVQLHGLTPEDIEAAVCEGAISPAEARTLAQTIVALKTVHDLDKLAERLEEVERLLKDGDTI